MMVFKTRSEAKKFGAKYYHTGRPCKHGHISDRQTSNSTCIDCNRSIALVHYRRNSKSRIALVAEYRDKNPRKAKQWARRSYEKNKEAYCARSMERHTTKLQRMPLWLTEQHRKEIRAVYKERDRLAEATGKVFHVDHIVPLRGETVSGLHVPWNLQILTAFDNLSKSNKFSEVA